MIQTLKKNSFLIEELIKRDFKKKYKRSILGIAWSLLNPLLTLLIMRLVFSRFFASGIEHYTTYLFCGNIIFSFFQAATSEGLLTLQNNSNIFAKVNIPKYFFVLSKNLQVTVNFMATFAVFLLMCLIDGVPFTGKFFMLLYPILMLLIFNIGVGLTLSMLYVFFRDISYLWTIITQLLLYVSAIFYSVEPYSDAVKNLFLLNPVYVYIRYFRQIVLEVAVPSPQLHALAAFYAFAALAVGLAVYKKLDDELMYYI